MTIRVSLNVSCGLYEETEEYDLFDLLGFDTEQELLDVYGPDPFDNPALREELNTIANEHIWGSDLAPEAWWEAV